MTTADKIGVLADAAKYDASCSTSGSARKNGPGGLGTGVVGGICHAWASDGRCVALLKVLLSNACAYDCAYCVNRRSNDVRRTGFEPEELVKLILDFYRRNYIEGAFLSSAVLGCPDATMERLLWVARTLRTRERYNGYLHLKVIPGASEALVLDAARWADRVSVNIELPSAASLSRIAPDKAPGAILGPMRSLAEASGFSPPRALPGPRMSAAAGASPAILGGGPAAGALGSRGAVSPARDAAAPWGGAAGGERAFPGGAGALGPPIRGFSEGGAALVPRPAPRPRPMEPRGPRQSVWEARKTRPRDPEAPLMPAGQTTQMVIGASPESDAVILGLAEDLYLAYDVRRVYYSAFVPTGGDPRVPALEKPPLAREHRLYQADWLFRFYGFRAGEILDAGRPFLEPDLDPKSSWALRNLQLFPVEVLTAEYRELLRVPGIGPKSASRIVAARRRGSLRAGSLGRLGVTMRRAKWFLTLGGKPAWAADPDAELGPVGMAPARGPSRVLERPEFLRSLLRDPAFRKAPGQPDLPWGAGS